jgi:hypothetical protein
MELLSVKMICGLQQAMFLLEKLEHQEVFGDIEMVLF